MDKIAIPCTCGCSVVAFFDFSEYDEPMYADFYTSVRPDLKHRVKTAWEVFRRRENWIHDVELDENGLRQLRDFLNEHLKD